MASIVSVLTGFDFTGLVHPINISVDFLPAFCKLAVFSLSLLI